jgi:hypothetical protein
VAGVEGAIVGRFSYDNIIGRFVGSFYVGWTVSESKSGKHEARVKLTSRRGTGKSNQEWRDYNSICYVV